MSFDEYRKRVRLTLSDDSGDLKFKAFDIVDAPECRGAAEALQRRLLDRPLAGIDPREIARIRSTGDAQCLRAAADVIAEFQADFTSRR